jgi:hypothetical protein
VLQERTRERVPLDWAMTQNNLGTTRSGRPRGQLRAAWSWLKQTI